MYSAVKPSQKALHIHFIWYLLLTFYISWLHMEKKKGMRVVHHSHKYCGQIVYLRIIWSHRCWQRLQFNALWRTDCMPSNTDHLQSPVPFVNSTETPIDIRKGFLLNVVKVQSHSLGFGTNIPELVMCWGFPLWLSWGVQPNQWLEMWVSKLSERIFQHCPYVGLKISAP